MILQYYDHDQTGVEEALMSTYRNPVISGFHPDPSVCRVGSDYYLVTSTFEYFPGVPLFHSKDLVNWEQIGHCLTRESQLDLRKAGSSGGVYAPTIREHEGTFYMVTTNVSGGGNFYVTTTDPRGEWSDPIFVDQPGIDPDLFFDEDGTVYMTSSANQGVYQSRIDVKTGKRLTEPVRLWSGTGGQYPEAPHIYRIGEWYYLMIAEGGTEYGHMETIARSKRPDGPFESCPHNPILTHRSRLSTIHATGHADLVQTPEGDWYAVFLGIRPVGYPNRHHLGRETFLTPVTWSPEGWPVFGENGMVGETMPSGRLPLQSAPSLPVREDFDFTDRSALAPHWTFLRTPDAANWSLDTKAGSLTLFGNADNLNSGGTPAFLGRRQQHFACRAAAHLTFEPSREGEEAGLTVYMNERFHYEIALTQVLGQRKLIFRRRLGSLSKVEQEMPWTSESVVLTIEADKEQYRFGFIGGDGETVAFGQGECAMLATEVAGGFTGVFIAMYAAGNGAKAAPAHYDWFDYEGLEA